MYPLLPNHPTFVGQVPAMDLDELCEPTMVTIIASNNSESEPSTFRVPLELICSRSRYFQALFHGSHREAQTRIAELRDDPRWAFKTYIGWLYTSRIAVAKSDQAKVLGEDSEADNPTSWPYRALLELYVFADKYDTRVLRNLVTQYLQRKFAAADDGLCLRPRDTFKPPPEYLAVARDATADNTTQTVFLRRSDVDYLVQNLPFSSPLARCIAWALTEREGNLHAYSEAWCRWRVAFGGERVADLPSKLAMDYLMDQTDHVRWLSYRCDKCGYTACRLGQKRACDQHEPLEAFDVRSTPKAECLFHEHDTPEERKVCWANLGISSD